MHAADGGYNYTAMPANDIRARIEQRLETLGLSMQKASKDAGLSEAFLKHFLAGRQDDITVGKLEALAPILKTTPGWLLDGEGDEAVQPDPDTAKVYGIVPHLKKQNLEKAADYLQMLRDSQKRGKGK